MNPLLLLIIGVIAASIFGSGVTIGMRWEEGKQVLENQHIAQAVEAANASAADAIAKIKVTNKTIQGEVRHETETHTIYTDCRLTPVGMQLATQALDGSKPAGDLKLPSISAPAK